MKRKYKELVQLFWGFLSSFKEATTGEGEISLNVRGDSLTYYYKIYGNKPVVIPASTIKDPGILWDRVAALKEAKVITTGYYYLDLGKGSFLIAHCYKESPDMRGLSNYPEMLTKKKGRKK